MTIEELWATLRAATEDDVEAALVDANVQLPITMPVELLEAFSCILDQLTMERDAAEMFDDEVIAAARAHRSSADAMGWEERLRKLAKGEPKSEKPE